MPGVWCNIMQLSCLRVVDRVDLISVVSDPNDSLDVGKWFVSSPG